MAYLTLNIVVNLKGHSVQVELKRFHSSVDFFQTLTPSDYICRSQILVWFSLGITLGISGVSGGDFTT